MRNNIFDLIFFTYFRNSNFYILPNTKHMRKVLSLFAVLLMFTLNAFSQTKNVSGKIVDQQGQPVPFASVRVKGTKVGVAADADGNFIIKAKQGDMLLITGSGITPVQFTVSDPGSFVSIKVVEKQSTLNEVVVTALGIAKQSKSLGYSTEKVTAKDITTAQPVSLANGLTGKVSGLEVNTVNNGLFAPTRITLRGNRSLIGNNQPLVVVDGAIFYNDISTINPEDIESVNVLKGSSSSAIYGSDASNGVMVITTKHGSGGRTSVTFSTTTQIEKVAYLPSFQSQFGSNGGEYYVYNYNDLSTYIPFENQSYGPQFNGAMVPYGRPLADGTLHFIPYKGNPNQKKDFFNTGITEQNNLSFSSGDDKSRFFMSAQDINSKNPMPGDIGRRDVFRVGGSKTYGIFTADFSLSYTNTNKNTTATGTVYNMLLNTPNQIPISTLRNWASDPLATTDGYFNDYFYNPYWIAGNIRNITKDNSLEGNMHFMLKPAKWVSLSYRLGANYSTEKYEYQQGEADYNANSNNNDSVYFSNSTGTATVLNTNFGTKWIDANNGYKQPAYLTSNSSNFLLTSDFVASFNKKFGTNFELNGNLGSSYVDNQINYLNANANNIFFPVYSVNSLTGIPNVTQYFAEAKKLGFFGDAQIGYKEFAFLHGSYRSDLDSRLSKSNRFIPYYDVDASLVLSEIIPGMRNATTFDFLKINGAYSVTGNATALAAGLPYLAAGAYRTTPTLTSVRGFPFNGLGGYQLNPGVANPNIKPEQVTEEEIGLELGFLKSRIVFKASVYDQKLTNGIVNASLPNSSGFTTALLNAANTDNKGIELDLKANVIQTRDWSWKVNVNYSHNETKVVTIDGGLKSLGISQASGTNFTGGATAANGSAYAIVGQLYPIIQGNDWVRDPSGHVIVNAVTGLPSISSQIIPLGNAAPKDILGISTSVTWKNFSISVTADYRAGYKTYNNIAQFMAFTGSSSYTTQTNRQRFVFPNSVIQDASGKYITNTNVIVNDANFNLFPGLFNNVASPWVQSAAAWKLREVAINYNIPVKVLGNQKVIKAATLTISGRNLLMLRPKTNQWSDPEFSEDTSNAVGENSINQAPPTRIIGGTVRVTF